MKKYVSILTAWGLSFGFAVGWGSFVMPATSFLPGAGPWGTLIGIFLGTLVMSIIAWNYHKLVNRHQCSGGAFVFAQDAFGTDYGFLTAWFLILAYLSILWANATALVLIVRYIMGNILQFGFHYIVADFDVYFGEALLSALFIMAAGALCLFHKRLAVRLNLISIATFALCVFGLFAIAVYKHDGGISSFSPAFSPLRSEGKSIQILGILGMMPWAFVGFEAISNSSAEFTFAPRRTFWVLLAAILASMFAYSMLALLPVLSLPSDCANWADYISKFRSMGGTDALPTLGATCRLIGHYGKPLFFVMMLAATFTGILASTVASSRLLHGL
ncbi:MAG: APC family permease, partial [Victivallales bacterium]|nr:APC family permease [Victivallales bacterium]